MNPIEFRKRLVGGLSLNTNLNEVQPTDYIDGYDIVDKSPKSKNEDGLLQPCSNTILAYDLGEAELTKKKYRVSMDLTGLEDCNLLFSVKVLGLLDATAPIAYTEGTNAAATLVLIQNALPDEVIDTVLVSGFILIFDIQFINLEYTDYFLSVSNSLGGVYETVATVDAISVDKVGIFFPSCFSNINNDQQIFSTTNTKEPQILTAPVDTTGTGLRLLFASDPEIEDGEEVYIYSQLGGLNQISSVCTIERTTGNTYQVIGVTTTPITASGTYVVVRNYRTLSVVGYAQKNDIRNQWSYTELLRSNKLNFRLYKQIQGALDITSDGIIYDWTDFLNPMRRLIYKGEIETGGFLTVYNADAIYDLDTIDVEGRLQLGVNTSKVTLQVATQTGVGGKTGYSFGAKKEACYAAFIRFKTSDGAYSAYSKASNVLWLRTTGLRDHSNSFNSGRAIQITLEQIPADIYDFVQVGIIEFTTDSWKGYSLPEIEINGQETIYVADSGFDTSAYIDFNDANILLEQIPFVFENAKSILAYNNYRLAANANLYQQYDLTDWAQDITLTVVRREIVIGVYDDIRYPDSTSTLFLTGINDYSKCSNEWMSYMPNDHYRFCIFIDWENGAPTSTYWIEDVSFEPIDTGLTNGDDVCAVSGTDLTVYQYYIKATDIDLDYILPNGKLLRDEVKDIRFGRALCNQQVQTTGLGIAVFLNGTVNYVSGFSDSFSFSTIVNNRLALFSPDYQNTNNIFNWQPNDILKSSQAQLGGGGIYGGTFNQAFSYNRNSSPQASLTVTELVNTDVGGANSIARFKYNNTGVINIRGGAAVILSGSLNYPIPFSDTICQNFYYIRQYGVDGAYPSPPQQTRFFVLPQDKWYNKNTHTSATEYEIYGGDAFPTLSAYKTAENISDPLSNNSAVTFWSYNRTNTALRSGIYPFISLETYLENPYLTTVITTNFPYDRYTYDACFTPRYIFQNSVAFNPLLPQFTNQFSTLYYSNQSFSSNVSGGNRTWLPQDNKLLETKYGAITHIETLLGQTGTNILIVWQERRVTAQYFDNTANIKSNTGELLMGNGAVLGRDGQNFTEFGCEHKWTIVKGQTDTGKDVAYWVCFRKTALMRFGADGTSNIIGDLSYLIENKTILALNNGYNNADEPAYFNGCHAVWDNKRGEYIVTLRLMPKPIPYGDSANIGQFKQDPTLKWGFEQFPVMYRSLTNLNNDVPPSFNWQTLSGYNSDYFEIITIVWNEKDNKFKAYRTYSPKIYGQFNDNYVSSHPTQGNLIYEHNDVLSEAMYYGVETVTAVTATTDPATFRINGAGIELTFPSPFAPSEREKYIVTINGKNYEVVGTGTDYLEMANVDDDDILPQETIPNFRYSVVNSQDPYIIGMCNNPEAKYFHFEQKSVQADDALKRMEYEAGYNGLGTTLTKGFSVKSEEVYQNGTWDTQIRQDTTSNPTNNTLGRNKVEGVWMKFKNIFRWGKNNKVLITIIKALETQKTK
jgi:hypothetical protein